MKRSNPKILKNSIPLLLGFLVIGGIIWLDINTSLWQEAVVLGGVAAGLVTFLLTVLVLDKVLARSHSKKWEPITHLALTEIIHSLADEQNSEISRGVIVPQEIKYYPLDSSEISSGELSETHKNALHKLRKIILQEHLRLQKTLATWANFLTGSDETEEIVFLTAKLALLLEDLRDATLALEEKPSLLHSEEVKTLVTECNRSYKLLIEELETEIRLAAERSRKKR